MAHPMRSRKAFANNFVGTGDPRDAAAQAAAQALLRSVARQAIIAAAADAINDLRGGPAPDGDFFFPMPAAPVSSAPVSPVASSRPGGPIGEGNPDDDDNKVRP